MFISLNKKGLPRKLSGLNCNHKAPTHRTYTHAALSGDSLESLQKGFWHETLLDHCNTIISHIALESCGFDVGGQMLFAALVDLAQSEDALAYTPNWHGKNPEESAAFSKFCIAQLFMIHSIMHHSIRSVCGQHHLEAIDRMFAACSTQIAIAAQRVLEQQHNDVQEGIEA